MYRKVRWHSAYFKNTIQILLNLYELLDVVVFIGKEVCDQWYSEISKHDFKIEPRSTGTGKSSTYLSLIQLKIGPFIGFSELIHIVDKGFNFIEIVRVQKSYITMILCIPFINQPSRSISFKQYHQK